MRLILRRFSTSASIKSLSLWEMEKLGNLGFCDIVYHVYHCGEPEPPLQAKSHSTDCPPPPPFHLQSVGAPALQWPVNRRRRKNGPAAATPEVAEETVAPLEAVRLLPRSRHRQRKASSIPQGLEAIHELTAGPEAVPELSKLLALQVATQAPCPAGAS